MAGGTRSSAAKTVSVAAKLSRWKDGRRRKAVRMGTCSTCSAGSLPSRLVTAGFTRLDLLRRLLALARLVLGLGGAAVAGTAPARDDAVGADDQADTENEQHWDELRPHGESFP